MHLRVTWNHLSLSLYGARYGCEHFTSPFTLFPLFDLISWRRNTFRSSCVRCLFAPRRKIARVRFDSASPPEKAQVVSMKWPFFGFCPSRFLPARSPVSSDPVLATSPLESVKNRTRVFVRSPLYSFRTTSDHLLLAVANDGRCLVAQAEQ